MKIEQFIRELAKELELIYLIEKDIEDEPPTELEPDFYEQKEEKDD